MSNVFSSLSLISETRLASVQKALAVGGINVDSYDWFIEQFQTLRSDDGSVMFDDGTNDVITLGELLELRDVRLSEGQVPLDAGKVDSFFSVGAKKRPLIAYYKSKVVRHLLWEPVVIGSVWNNPELRVLVGGGHRTTAIEIILLAKLQAQGVDTSVVYDYLSNTNINVVHRIYPDIKALAEAQIASNSGRNMTATEQGLLKVVADNGFNPNSLDELNVAIRSGDVNPGEWLFKLLPGSYHNPATGKPLADNTLQAIVKKVHAGLITTTVPVFSALPDGSESDTQAAEQKLFADLLLGAEHGYKLNDEQYAVYQELYGESWKYNDKTKQYNWVIPSELDAVLSLIDSEIKSYLGNMDTEEGANIARNHKQLVESVVKGVVNAVLDDEDLSAYRRPPIFKAATKARTKVTATKAK